MRMVVAEGVMLVKPLADGRDYAAGELIELDQAVAESWRVRGWVRVPIEIMLPPVIEQTDWSGGHRRQSKGSHV